MDRSFWKTVLATTLGVLVAAAILFGLHLVLWPGGVAMHDLMGQMNRSIPARPVAVAPPKPAGPAATPAVTAAPSPTSVVLAAPTVSAPSGTADAMAADARKEAAWQKYYKRSPQCDKPDGSGFVECANQHIRARRAFEAQYAAGKL